MTDASGAIPGGVEIILHVCIVGKELAIYVKATVENVPVSGGHNLPILTIRRHFVNDAGRSQAITIMPPSIGHPWKQVIFPPIHGYTRTVRFNWSGIVPCDQVNRFLVGAEYKGMYTMITACLHAPQFLNLIQLVVSVRVREPVDSALHLFFIIIDGHIQAIKCPKETIRGSDIDRDFFDITFFECFSLSWDLKTIESTKLITGNDTVFVVQA